MVSTTIDSSVSITFIAKVKVTNKRYMVLYWRQKLTFVFFLDTQSMVSDAWYTSFTAIFPKGNDK